MLRKIFFCFSALILFAGIVSAEKIINLPTPNTQNNVSVEQAIYYRRSEREFLPQPLTQEQISQLLWAGQGITDTEFGFRAAPSSGALYPLRLYVVNSEGVFRYIPDGHKLIQLSNEDARASLCRASLGQSAVRDCPLSIVITGNFAISQAKYGARAFRYVCMEAGHAAENINLQAVALGLASVNIGSFWDDVVRKNLNIPDNEDPLYIIPIGYLKK